MAGLPGVGLMSDSLFSDIGSSGDNLLGDLHPDGEVKPRKNPSILSRIGQIVTSAPAGMMQLASDVVRAPLFGVQSIADGDFGERFPALFGIGKGAQTTAHHLNPLEFQETVQDFKDDPVGNTLNDIGNLSIVASGGLAAAGKAGLLAGTAGGRSATVASRVEQVARAGNKVADLPMAPWRFAGTRALEGVGARAAKAVDGGSTSAVSQGLVRFSPNAKAMQSAILDGTAQERQALAGLDPADETAGVLRDDIRDATAQRLSNLPFVRQGAKGEMPEGFTSLKDASKFSLRGDAAEISGVPQSMVGELGRMFTAPNSLPGAKVLGETLGPINRLHRIARMDLSPGWAFGQLPGNATMLMGHSPHPFKDMGRYIRHVKDGKMADNPRIATTGTDVAKQEVLDNSVPGKVNEVLTKAEGWAAKTKMADVAQRLDGASRSAFYEGRIADGHSPAVAQEMTMRALGEFDKLGPIEQAYVRPAIPFYRWSREVLKMTAHLAEDHPMRAGAMAQLGRIQSDSTAEAGPGEREVDGSFLVPFGQSGDSFKGVGFGIPKKLNPALKLAAIAGTGKSLSTGKDLYVEGRAFGEDNHPGFHNLRPGLQSIAGGYPVARAAKPNERYQDRSEAAFSFLTGVDVSHKPTEAFLAREKAERAAKNQVAKIKRLTEAAKAGK